MEWKTKKTWNHCFILVLDVTKRCFLDNWAPVDWFQIDLSRQWSRSQLPGTPWCVTWGWRFVGIPSLAIFLEVPFFLKQKNKGEKFVASFPSWSTEETKHPKEKKHFGGNKLKLLLLLHRPAPEKRKTSQLSLKLCAQQGPKSLSSSNGRRCGKKKTADSRQWFKWQKAKAIQLTT